MSQNLVLEVSHLTKQFKKYKAVNDISFNLKEGEILGILGPNGAGKTTTIQMLLNVLTPTNGSISYFGKDFKKHREEILSQVNFSSTYVSLPWRLTVFENLNVYAHLYNVKDKKNRIKKLVKIFEIEDMLKHETSSLSSGQNTRLMLVKAFLNYPKVLLLDEPTSSLDPDIAKKVREFLRKEQRDFNVSILLTSHNMPEVEELCDRVLFLDKGKIIAEDTPEGLASRIKYSHVALFVTDGLKRLLRYCKDNNLVYKEDKRSVLITLKEDNIAELLFFLSQEGIVYKEISIQKPELEDFFMEAVKKK